ncbi:MAG: 2-isopropylmalate synthase, partial [Solirubrobacteraceae bacterium]|nr:2-isopropylmalate synthase [Solirubrobacteraceae bacterium]
TKGTGAVTRVLIDASDGHDVWGTIGVSENVIAASWDALVDSLEYGMQPGREPAAARDGEQGDRSRIGQPPAGSSGRA